MVVHPVSSGTQLDFFFSRFLGEVIQKSNMGLSKKTAVKTLRQNALTLATLGGVLVGIILGKFVYNLS